MSNITTFMLLPIQLEYVKINHRISFFRHVRHKTPMNILTLFLVMIVLYSTGMLIATKQLVDIATIE